MTKTQQDSKADDKSEILLNNIVFTLPFQCPVSLLGKSMFGDNP